MDRQGIAFVGEENGDAVRLVLEPDAVALFVCLQGLQVEPRRAGTCCESVRQAANTLKNIAGLSIGGGDPVEV